jgi:mannose/fructose-specific phosphotransferase system component IIA
MVRFFLSSHGHLASGLKSSIDILLGDSSCLTVFDAYVDEKSLEEVLNRYYDEIVGPEDQVILLSDMYGGSVNSIMYLFLNRPNTMLIAGVNLALVIGLVVNKDNLPKEQIEELIRESREAIRIVESDGTDLTNQGIETEDLF